MPITYASTTSEQQRKNYLDNEGVEAWLSLTEVGWFGKNALCMHSQWSPTNKITILFLTHSVIDLESGDSTRGPGIAAGIHLHTSSNKK